MLALAYTVDRHWNYSSVQFTATTTQTTVQIMSLVSGCGCMLFDNVTVIDTTPGCNGPPTTTPPAAITCGQTIQGYTTNAMVNHAQNFTFLAQVKSLRPAVITFPSTHSAAK
jgi:hypothetical protein